MSKTSSEVKNRWNNKTYDRITICVSKGQKEVIKNHAESIGESVNSYINKLIQNDMNRPK